MVPVGFVNTTLIAMRSTLALVTRYVWRFRRRWGTMMASRLGCTRNVAWIPSRSCVDGVCRAGRSMSLIMGAGGIVHLLLCACGPVGVMQIIPEGVMYVSGLGLGAQGCLGASCPVRFRVDLLVSLRDCAKSYLGASFPFLPSGNCGFCAKRCLDQRGSVVMCVMLRLPACVMLGDGTHILAASVMRRTGIAVRHLRRRPRRRLRW
jgi:hypothetical protein